MRERKKLIFLQISFSLSITSFLEKKEKQPIIFFLDFSLSCLLQPIKLRHGKRHFSIEKFCALLLIRIYTHFAVVVALVSACYLSQWKCKCHPQNKWRKNVEANQKAGFDFFIELSFCCAGRLLCEYVQRNKETLAAYLEIIKKLAFL